MPKSLLQNVSASIKNKSQGLLNRDLDNPFDISELSGYNDDPIIDEPPMEEMLGARRPPEHERQFRPITESLVDAVVQVESSGKWDAISPVGAVGLMQVRPQFAVKPGYGAKDVFTIAEEMGVSIQDIGKDEDGAKRLLMNPEVNRAYGSQYLEALQAAFDGNTEHALVAYNWGPGNARQWIRDGANPRDLPDETRNYLSKIEEQFAQTSGEDNASTT